MGKQRFKKFYDNLSSTRGKSSISRLEVDFLDLLEKQLGISIIRQISLFMFSWDGLLEDKKILLEVNGTFWHRDPRFYKKSFVFGFNGFKEESSEEVWAKDERKRKAAIQNGYKVLTFWEFDIRTNPKSQIEKLEKELKLNEFNLQA